MSGIAEGRVRARVPDLVFLEVANAFLKYVRAGTMTVTEAYEGLDRVLDAPLEVVPARRLGRQALALAIVRGVSVYDAAYLALALGTDSILVTADRRLADQAERSALLPDDGPPV